MTLSVYRYIHTTALYYNTVWSGIGLYANITVEQGSSFQCNIMKYHLPDNTVPCHRIHSSNTSAHMYQNVRRHVPEYIYLYI